MSNNQIKLFNYSGNKQWFISQFNFICEKYLVDKPDVIIDSFAGSGAVSFNNNATKTYLNEYNIWIYAMLRCSHTETFYNDYLQCLNYITTNFGDIKNNKESYYTFRNWWNETYYNRYKNITTIPYTRDFTSASIFLICLANTCLNSMLRFGPNGMNQSFGRRNYIIDKDDCIALNAKDIEFTNFDFFNSIYQQKLTEIEFENNDKKIAVFLDPPYEFREMTYNNGFSTQKFIDVIKQPEFMSKSLIVYTDIENPISDTLLQYGYTKHYIREMKSTSPNRKNENKTGDEVMYIRKV
jgi:16S rRNA G966 N2-methylase RsmD